MCRMLKFCDQNAAVLRGGFMNSEGPCPRSDSGLRCRSFSAREPSAKRQRVAPAGCRLRIIHGDRAWACGRATRAWACGWACGRADFAAPRRGCTGVWVHGC